MEPTTGAVEQIVALLLSLGLPGVIIIALAYAYLQKDKRVNELQDTLFDVGRESAKAMEANTASLNRLSDMLLRGKVE
jgi:hypothetical protein